MKKRKGVSGSKPKVLLIGGSFNQSTQMAQIAEELPDERFDKWFSVAYGDGLVDLARRVGLLEWTILGRRLSMRGMEHLAKNGVRFDHGARQRSYDLVILSYDLIVPRNIRNARMVLVQEGMTDPENWAFHLARRLRWLPRWIASTSTTGLSDLYDRFCVASEGYRDLFIKKGVRPEKIVVTSIPNFDDCSRYRRNSFPYRDYVLVCPSDSRETFKFHNRRGFLSRAKRIAAGRQLIFKLHPNENWARAAREIQAIAPDALIFTRGSAEEMVANCSVLVVEYSSLAYVGLALGKEVHAWEDIATLRRLMPIQNGDAARRIARVACDVMGLPAPAREVVA
ncbi:MAG TPA: hypothetical protein VMK12_06540 [Anaeromyxobacteraceae bacterium]|nr:hypothetical protein [Anaeromyxobacteraceae bacterium]